MVDGEDDADDVDEDPEKVDDVVSEWTLDQRTRGFSRSMIDVRSHGSTEKCWTQVDCNTCEPAETIIHCGVCCKR